MNPRHFLEGAPIETQRVFCRRYFDWVPRDGTRQMMATYLHWAACSRRRGGFESARLEILEARKLRLLIPDGIVLGSDADFFDEFTEIEG